MQAAEERAVGRVLPAGGDGHAGGVAAAEGRDVDGVAEGVLGELGPLRPVAVAAGIGVDDGDGGEPGGERRLRRREPGGERLGRVAGERRRRLERDARGARRGGPGRRCRSRRRRRSRAAACRRGAGRRRPRRAGADAAAAGPRRGPARSEDEEEQEADQARALAGGAGAAGGRLRSMRGAARPFRPPCKGHRGALFGGDDSPRAPAPSHRRLRQPGDAADRAPPAGVADLLRDPPLPEGRRRLPAGVPAAGGDPFGRAGERDRGRAARGRRTEIFTLGVPVLGICYGQQTMMAQLGGKVEGGHEAEFGRACVTPDRDRATPSSPASSRPGARRCG